LRISKSLDIDFSMFSGIFDQANFAHKNPKIGTKIENLAGLPRNLGLDVSRLGMLLCGW